MLSSMGLNVTEEDIFEAIALNNSFVEAGKIFKKVYGIEGIERNKSELDRLISEGWEIAMQDKEKVLLGCNNVVDTYLDEEGVLRFEYGSNL